MMLPCWFIDLLPESPMVKVTRKDGYEGLETLMCQIYGFYPREIEANWRKDGEILEHKTFRGGISPNLDGTYHTWLSIEIDPQDRGLYRCHVEHNSLPKALDVAWKNPGEQPGRKFSICMPVHLWVSVFGAEGPCRTMPCGPPGLSK